MKPWVTNSYLERDSPADIFPEQQPFRPERVRIGSLGEMRAPGSSHKIMLRPSGRLGLALLLLAGLTGPAREGLAQTPAVLPPQASSAATSSGAAPPAHKSKSHAKKSAPETEAPQIPPSPPTLEQQAPTPPQVSYQNGQLSIVSQNATLSQVLHSVQTQTGASLDMPPGAGAERVVVKLGPGKPKDVLASLLNGSKFNYVILGEPDNLGGVQKVILLAKSTSSAETTAMTTAQNNYRPPVQSQAVEPPEDEYPANEPEVDNQNQFVPGQPGADGMSPDGTTPDGTPDGINASPGVIAPGSRTPEQMLQELQRMQQQQQQLQQQLNPANRQLTPLPSRPSPISPQSQ